MTWEQFLAGILWAATPCTWPWFFELQEIGPVCNAIRDLHLLNTAGG